MRLTPGQIAVGRNRRRRRIFSGLGVLVLLGIGLAMDPSIVAPFGPFASKPEQVGATFSRCGRNAPSFACVVDGDTIRLGKRSVRIVGIDAPEIGKPLCPAEAALGEKAAARLLELVNAGPFEMVGHRFNSVDRYGRDLMVLRRGDASIGDRLIAEGLAHRYMGVKKSWC